MYSGKRSTSFANMFNGKGLGDIFGGSGGDNDAAAGAGGGAAGGAAGGANFGQPTQQGVAADNGARPPIEKVKPPGVYGRGGSGFNAEPMEMAASVAVALGRERNPAATVYDRRKKLAEQQSELRSKTLEFVDYVSQANRVIQQKAGETNAQMRQLKDQHVKAREDYKDELTRQRDVDKMKLNRLEKEKAIQMEEEMAAKQEQIRRATLEFEAQLRQKTELERVKAETEGRILAERRNHDLRLEQSKQKAAETRKTLLSGIKLAGQTLGSGAAEFLSNREEMSAVVLTLTAAAFGIYSAKTGTGIMGRYIEARLGRPSLVRETSRRSVLDTFRHPLKGAQRLFRTIRPGDALEGDAALPKAIFVPRMEARLRGVAESAANTKANRAPFRHLLLHGPPGTGKTLFAKGLANHSGLDYAIMTGGDVAPLGREAVSEMHKLFDWAQASRRGVLLFVDEADAFLRRRSTEAISEDMRNALNAFLYRTGEQTDRFMVVYASNQPEQFDDAINDRIDEMVPFELPALEERYRMLTYYMSKYLLKEKAGRKAATIVVTGVEERHIREAAEATEGFSGRELSKLAIAWQAAAYGSDPVVFTPELMASVTDSFLEQKTMKTSWDASAAAAFSEDTHAAAPGNPQHGAGLPQLA